MGSSASKPAAVEAPRVAPSVSIFQLHNSKFCALHLFLELSMILTKPSLCSKKSELNQERKFAAAVLTQRKLETSV